MDNRSDLRLLASLDRALDVYGESMKQVIYSNLETMFGVKRESIIDNPEKFVETLDKIFGSGSGAIKKTILVHMEELTQNPEGVSSTELSNALRDASPDKARNASLKK
ncbi:MAG: hypothetical protein PXY39_11475 [archaeon]|nr:hypothetical protein [archaeon]